ncbi:hypothetical protein ACMD2_24725, partial [Ananas comosus]
MSSAVIIVREAVLLEHLLRTLRNVGVHPSRVDARRLLGRRLCTLGGSEHVSEDLRCGALGVFDDVEKVEPGGI